MEFRHRSRTRANTAGIVRANGEIVGGGWLIESVHETSDFWKKQVRTYDPWLSGLLPPSPFESDFAVLKPTYLSGGSFFIMESYPVERQDIPGYADLYIPQGHWSRILRNNGYAIDLLERTNPGRSDFSVPVFIKELLDLPNLFRLAAKNIFNFAGGAYLNYQFGWTQLRADVLLLHKLTSALEKRVREFHSLQQVGGLRRRIDLAHYSTSGSVSGVPINSAWGTYVEATARWHCKLTIAGSVRWTCSRDFSKDLEQIGFFNLALRNVLDLEVLDAKTAWELIPWSWLVDYFVDIGGYLGSGEGSHDFTAHDICIMWEYYARETHSGYQYPESIRLSGPGVFTRHIKSRDLVTDISFPSLRTELLSWSQWKVVIALFLRLKRFESVGNL